jgi:putative flippase GtrA
MLSFILLFVTGIILLFISLYMFRHLRTWIRSWRIKEKGTHTYVRGGPKGKKAVAMVLGMFMLFIGLILNVGVLTIVLLMITGNTGIAELLLNMASNAAYIEASPYGFKYIGPFTNYTPTQIYYGGVNTAIVMVILTMLGAAVLLALMKSQPMVKGNPL